MKNLFYKVILFSNKTPIVTRLYVYSLIENSVNERIFMSHLCQRCGQSLLPKSQMARLWIWLKHEYKRSESCNNFCKIKNVPINMVLLNSIIFIMMLFNRSVNIFPEFDHIVNHHSMTTVQNFQLLEKSFAY